MLKETWVRVDVSRPAALALVLDASESAQTHWPGILRLANELLARFQGSAQCLIYFLGDTKAHTREDLAAHHIRLFASHRTRASLLSPLLEVLEGETNTLCIALCAGRIFDLEDWLGMPIAERLLLVNFGNSSVSGDVCSECEASLEEVSHASPVVSLLGTPARVELSGNSLMPFSWDNHSYTWRGGKLAAEKAEIWKVHVGVLCVSGTDISATAIMSGNVSFPAECSPSSPRPLLPNWKELSPQDAKIFRESIRTGEYSCPFCGNNHPAAELRCKHDTRSLLGRYVYSFLLHSSQGGKFVLLRDSSDDVCFSYYPCDALRLDQNSIAIHSRSGADVYEFDPHSAVWLKSTQKLKQYKIIQDALYAIAV